MFVGRSPKERELADEVGIKLSKILGRKSKFGRGFRKFASAVALPGVAIVETPLALAQRKTSRWHATKVTREEDQKVTTRTTLLAKSE